MNTSQARQRLQSFGKNCLAFLETSLDLFIPLDDFQDPMDRLRVRSLGLILLATMVVNGLQLSNAITFEAPRVVIYGMLAGVLGCFLIIVVLRSLRPSPPLAALIICLLITFEGILDFWLGRSPVTPFTTWYPLYVFLVIMIAGPRWGLFAALQMMAVSALHLLFSMHLPHPFVVSGNAQPEAYLKRLQGAILLSSVLSFILVSLYEYFFKATLNDLTTMQAGKSQRKRLELLGEFASGIARDLEQPLRSLEQLADEMRLVHDVGSLQGALPRIRESRLDILKITQTTQRYLMLSATGNHGQDKVMAVPELIDFVLNFPGRQEPSNRSRALRHGDFKDQLLEHSVGRLVILILCSVLHRIEGPLRGRLHALTFHEQEDGLYFTLIFVVQDAGDMQANFRELLVDCNVSLETIRGHIRLQLPASPNGPGSLILRVPRGRLD